MHIHILGICGTFMGGLALLARSLGHRVTGADANVYPPMSTLLDEQGIPIHEGWDPAQFDSAPDMVVIGNALSRGNPAVEYVLERGLPYTSGPQWLCDQLLVDRWVLAVAGTHGKTTTASMLAWILDYAGLAPGFLIGGVPQDFGVSARLGEAPFFVIEADEYDTAFFDKRSKFVHYRPRTLVLNNLEFDHADIFADLAAIQTQFHHLVRTVPANGLIIHPYDDAALQTVIDMGCWTPRETLASADHADETHTSQWQWREEDGGFGLCPPGGQWLTVRWSQLGRHNALNGLAAIAAARHAGVPVAVAAEALGSFQGVRRRMELRGEVAGIRVYDDFAHHPTAIATTLAGLRRQVGGQRILAVLEPRSNTMRLGIHRDSLPASLAAADAVYIYSPADIDWDAEAVFGSAASVRDSVAELIEEVARQARTGDHIVIMSNGGFDNIHVRLLERLAVAEGVKHD
ncbi:MAG TPA: UDP-N-acetylmuramate:L-alanyl-gamma-D-glutamyl-meso-diaminopimelate ligase [Gammaproteobacteria bacterium]|nr:UDP-N-acetylmuramate:L-alanyl-gamma-D-glutamyl-meso-diaminopimelate ligase [Gammaproteobacteria bacterium]